MKKHFMLVLLTLSIFCVLSAANLVNENIQSWTARASYGSYTQTITAGTVSMTQCIVQPSASASGTGSIGRVQMQATNGILELPSLASVGTAEFHLAAGGASRTLKLQQYIGSTWTDVTTFSGIGTTGATFTYDLNLSSSTTLRLANPSSAVYLHDIIITDYSGGTPGLAVLTTAVISSITQTTALSGGNITSDGGSSVTARGVCWSTSSNPTISGSHSSDGSGTGSFVSNISSLSAATLYYVRAYATNSQGTAYGDELSFTTSGSSPPSVPTAIAATNIGANSFTANWNAVSGATGYYLDVAANSSFSPMLSSYNNLYVSSNSQAVSGLSASTPYYYRVRATNSGGTSGNSNTITVTTSDPDPYNGYYNPVIGLSGTSLKDGLHTLIRDTHTTEFSYSNLETQMKITDEDPNNSNNVIELYTGWSVPKSSYGGGTTDWNKEHTWSKSHGDFGDTAPAGTDLHHLRPCDATVNSFKNNRDFDEGSNPYTDASPPSGYSGTTNCYFDDANDFEPRDADKGDVARMIFYMAVRYEGTDTSYDLELVDYTYSDEGTNEPFYGKLSTLLAWHYQDPPDAWEDLRNNRIESLQGNRNPFIDHPEWVSSIWGGSLPTTYVQFSPNSATVNEADGSISLSVIITDPSPTTATSAQIQLSTGSPADVGNYSTRTLTFPAGSNSSQSTSITITDDSLLEGNETLIFSLVNVSGGTNAAIGTNGSFTLNITDNDVPTVVALAASEIGDSGFTANWQTAAGISDYLFDLSANSGFSSYVGSYHDYPVSGTSVVISGLSENTDYYYRVKAIYNGAEGIYSNVISTTTTGTIYLDPPVAIAATAISHEGFTARWNEVSGATGYRLDVYTGSAATASDLIISEYVEGSSNNKYIEIFNGTGTTVDLSNYYLRTYYNGGSSYTNNVQLSGTLANGSCVVYMNSSAALILPDGVTAINNTACAFNGDDAVALYNSSSSANVDIFGCIGEDPGSAWTATGISTADRTLRRKATVTAGVTANPATGFPTLATEWDNFAVDTASGLGSHSLSGGISYLAGYQDLAVSPILARVSGLSPNAEYSYVVRAVYAGGTTASSNPIDVTTTSVLAGTGANTSIDGANTTVILPALSGYSNNNLELDPIATTNDDYSVSAAIISGGISYSISSNNSALNGSYLLHHDGLGFIPQGAQYSFGGNLYQVQAFNATALQTELIISGLAKNTKGTLNIELLQEATLPVELSSFTAMINATHNVALQWVSQSEEGMLGYYVLRANSETLDAAEIISPLVGATNTSQQQVYLFVDEELPGDGTYYYWLQDMDMDGSSGYHGPISVVFTDHQGGNHSPQLQTAFENSYPNPFSDNINLRYTLAKTGTVQFKIYNIKGQLVKAMTPESKSPGSHKALWNGTDEQGQSCGSGLYYIVMQAEGMSHVRKVIIAR